MSSKQFSTFYIGERLYGIDVMTVQEITKAMPITKVPLAPNFVHGLINLRGQIATAIGLRELFALDSRNSLEEPMNVVCKNDGLLLSLLVDRIGDVVEVSDSIFEPTPDTISNNVGKFLSGVYKTQGPLLSIIDVHKIIEIVNS